MAVRQAAASALTSLSAPEELLQECRAVLAYLSTADALQHFNQVYFCPVSIQLTLQQQPSRLPHLAILPRAIVQAGSVVDSL